MRTQTQIPIHDPDSCTLAQLDIITDGEGCVILVDDITNGWVAKVQVAVDAGQVVLRIWDEDALPIPEPHETIVLCDVPLTIGG